MKLATAPRAKSVRPTRARFRVVAFCVALAVVTYLDRACIGILSGDIRHDLGLSMQQMGFVFSAFTLAYAIFEIPSAWWGERIGARLVLARIVLWWSGFTMLTAAEGLSLDRRRAVSLRRGRSRSLAQCHPSIFKMDTSKGARARAGHLLRRRASGGRPYATLSIGSLATRRLAWSFSNLRPARVLMVMAWLRWFRDRPGEHPDVNEAELAQIAGETAAARAPSARTS